MCGHEREWTLRGQRVRLCVETVRQRLAGAPLGPIRQYYVEIDGMRYPLKRALARVTEIPLAGFTTQDAYRIFAALGFTVGEI